MLSMGDPIVLIVDDETEYLEDFKVLFSRKFNLMTAGRCEEALEILKNNNVGVIVSDQRMPCMTGSKFLTVAAEKYPKTVRILLTGYSDKEEVDEAFNKGKIFSCLTKDMPLAEIELCIQQAVVHFKSQE